MSYNDLWALAYSYASATKVPAHRVGQFASDYARTYEDVPETKRVTPRGYVLAAAACDFHYHD
jgi:hypothetical protein